jgi:hypothetical protein
MRRAGHVAHIGKKIQTIEGFFFNEILQAGDWLEDLDVDGRIILKQIF